MLLWNIISFFDEFCLIYQLLLDIMFQLVFALVKLFFFFVIIFHRISSIIFLVCMLIIFKIVYVFSKHPHIFYMFDQDVYCNLKLTLLSF